MKHFILTALSTGIALTAAAASAESLPADSARTHAFRREAAAASVSGSGAKSRGREHFLPTRRRIDREIDKLKFAYKGEVFHRSYAGLDPKGRFGLFAEFELSMSTGSTNFAYESGDRIKRTYSDNTQFKLAFNPGAAVYIFPNVCATLSFGLGGIQYTSVTQKDAEGHKIGSRKASNMKFKLNIAAINVGMTIHLWDKKKK